MKQVKRERVKGKNEWIRVESSRFRYSFLLLPLAFLFLPLAVAAQSRDILTIDEIEIVRDAQQIDDRIDVLVRSIDRRFAALNAPISVVNGTKEKKDDKEWGKAPTGTRTELLSDIKGILQKAADDIDNLAERPESMVIYEEEKPDKKNPKTFAALFPKAVRSLAAAATRYQPVLKAEFDRSTDNTEKGLIQGTLDLCADIIASVAKLK